MTQSNYRPQDFEEALKVAKEAKIEIHQLEVHPYVLSHIQPVLDICKANHIFVSSYGPLTPLSKHKTGGPVKPILDRIAKQMSEETGKEVDDQSVLLLWFRALGITPVTGSHNLKRIQTQANVQHLPDLRPTEVEEISAAGRKVYFRNYDEHMKVDFPRPDLPEDL